MRPPLRTKKLRPLLPRDLHLRHPYRAADRSRGFGVEDWPWHMETLWAGLPHRVVPETVHLIRVKEHGSLGRQNTVEGLLPYLPPHAWPQLGAAGEEEDGPAQRAVA